MFVSPALNVQHQINLPDRYCIVVHTLISIFLIHCICLFLYHHGQEPQMEHGTSYHLTQTLSITVEPLNFSHCFSAM